MSVVGQKHKARQLDVPGLGENPAERRRVLNVLAQRRYRRRKKDHLQKLEKRTQTEPLPLADQSAAADTDQANLPPTCTLFFDHMPDQSVLGLCAEDQRFVIEASIESQNPGDPLYFDPASLEAWDASFNFALPSLPTSPSPTTATTTPQSSTTQSTRSYLTSFDFADETYLPMLELNLLRGAMAIAKRLGVDSLMWSLESSSPFHNSSALAHTHLPGNLRPTTMQLRNAHHPVLDILPWPSVRDKLILVFSQPEDLRPPSARSPTALVDFVYDLEDSAEGVRIWGDDPYPDKNWEVGEKLFKNWWWALDGPVLHRSNQLRHDRGASILGTSREIQEVN